MTNPSRRNGLTLQESADLLSRLEKRSVSTNQVRAVLLLNTRGRALQPQPHGQTRVFSSDDIGAVRLVLRLRDQGVSPTVARVVVACLRDDLVRSWRLPLALRVTGLRGELVPLNAYRQPGTVAWAPLVRAWSGIEASMKEIRKAQPDVWQWKAQPATALMAGGLR